VLRTGMNDILSVPLPRWEGLGEGENGKGFSPTPLSSPIKGEEIVFKEIGKPRPVGGVIHLGWQRPSLDIELFKDVPLYNVQRPLLQRSLHLNMEEGL